MFLPDFLLLLLCRKTFCWGNPWQLDSSAFLTMSSERNHTGYGLLTPPLSLGIVLRFTHVLECVNSLFLKKTKQNKNTFSFLQSRRPLYAYTGVCRHSGVARYLSVSSLGQLRSIPRSGIGEPYGDSGFNLWRSWLTLSLAAVLFGSPTSKVWVPPVWCLTTTTNISTLVVKKI